MRHLKKIYLLITLFSFIAISVSTMNFIEPLNSSATRTSVKLGDSNGDGSFNLADSVAIYQYINGLFEPTAYQVTCMDINQDYVIDTTDAKMIQYYLLHSIPSQTVQKNLYTVPDMSGRYYYRHDCSSSNSASKTLYYIDTYLESINRGTSNESRFFTPTESYDYENLNVVRLQFGSGHIGSGIIVGDHIVATAAHCVYDRTLGEFYDVSVEVYNQNAVVDDSNLLCSTDALYLHIPKLYIDSTGGAQDNYDYALIYVEADLSQYGIWPLGIVTTEFMDSSEEVVSSGFRYYNTIYARYYSRGAVIHFDEQEDAPNLIQYRLYSAGISYNGKSGGAAYYEDSFNNILYKSLIGVITGAGSPSNGSRTWSDRITPTLIRFYKQNDYLTN